MREIQFMAWDKHLKKWVLDESSTSGWVLHLNYPENSNATVMQWKAPSFVISNVSNPNFQYPFYETEAIEREVIGNIYENPELIKEA